MNEPKFSKRSENGQTGDKNHTRIGGLDPLQGENAEFDLLQSPWRGIFQSLDFEEEYRGGSVHAVGEREDNMAIPKRAAIKIKQREDGSCRCNALNQMTLVVRFPICLRAENRAMQQDVDGVVQATAQEGNVSPPVDQAAGDTGGRRT